MKLTLEALCEDAKFRNDPSDSEVAPFPLCELSMTVSTMDFVSILLNKQKEKKVCMLDSLALSLFPFCRALWRGTPDDLGLIRS